MEIEVTKINQIKHVLEEREIKMSEKCHIVHGKMHEVIFQCRLFYMYFVLVLSV